MQMVCSLMITNELLGTVYGHGGPVELESGPIG